MKIPADVYNVMKEAFHKVVEFYGGPQKCQQQNQGKSREFMLWSVWWNAYHNLQYDDNHPFFANGKWQRILPHNPNFTLNDYNDAHIETALKKIAAEINL